ncbi:MAG: arabinan endo-1,5-alpha-L-arabinosidase [Bacteroidota bacterium]
MKLFSVFKYAILPGLIFGLLAGCDSSSTGSDEDTSEEPFTGLFDAFSGPIYPDDYTSIASWDQRSSWNLANVHDPTIVKDGDYFYMYQTDASYGNAHESGGHYPVRRSEDLVDWEHMGSVFDSAPSWVKDSLNSIRANMEPALPPIENPGYGFWAPHITKIGDTYRLYYSVVVTNPILGNDDSTYWTERAFIGLAESPELSSNNWEDKGLVLYSVADGVETYERNGADDWSGYFKFNAIDPTYTVTPEGEHWLIYGSWHSGIAAVEVDPETGKPTELNDLEDFGTRIAGRGDVNSNRWQALEAPEIIYNEETDYYYLFLAYDELSQAYNTRVARSRNITGPYAGIDGGNVTEGADAYPILTHPYRFDGHYGWVGFAHGSVFHDPDTGNWFYSSQGRLPPGVSGINASNAVMMGHVREIYWTDDGWPLVAPERYAAVPDTAITEEDIAGTWEEVTLEYQYQAMQQSKKIELNDDHSVSGGTGGTWSFNEETQTLTINNVDLIIDSAWDWEASPRRTTISYAGLTPSGLSKWGKKVRN